ncbi:MAG TPA: type II/IV secretion system ATPase subunit [Candidatus Thermoplasmatota archaeon]|nr:type II/IV secretion system ATPase subunit [Candidatus Thermoplasmatota archaeon]
MPQHVPVLEFFHELEASGIQAEYLDVLDRPLDYWRGLPAARREAFLARLGVDPSRVSVQNLQVLRRRGEPAVSDNLFVRFDLGETQGFQRLLHSARERFLFQPLQAPPLTKTVSGAAPAPELLEDLRVPQSVFREASLSREREPLVRILDRMWGGEPYDHNVHGPLCEAPFIPGFQQLESYWVEAPFAFVSILVDDEGALRYHVEEPRLTPLEKSLMVTLNDRLRDALLCDVAEPRTDRYSYLLEKVFQLLRLYQFRVDQRTAYKIGYYFARNYLGFGRLEPLMRDPHIEDISCNGPDLPIYVVQAKHQNLRTNLSFSELELNSFTIKLTQRGGKLLSVAEPLVDATLPDGSRIQASLGRNVTSRGSAFTIRKFREDPLTCVDLIRSGTHTPETLAFLWMVVEAHRSIVVMGATASGKTTTLNCLSQFIPPAKKIITIEDTREITLNHENWLAAVTREPFTGAESERISMYDLLRAALRQRPEYIIVGEIRGEEGLTLFQAMSTGHTCYSTMHAGSVENAVYRLENPPIGVPRVMLTALDYFLLQGQVDVKGKHARRMLSLTELNGIDSSTRNLRMNEVFRWDAESDGFESATTSLVMETVRQKRGWTRGRLEEELQLRRSVLEGLVARNERHYLQVAKAIRNFYLSRAEANGSDRGPRSVPVSTVVPAGAPEGQEARAR